MKAIEVTKPNVLAVVDRDIPEIKDNEVLIRVRAAGLCGSDVHLYHGANAFATYPRVPGHEFVGEIEKIGSATENVKVGDHVVIDPVVSCGDCYPCRIDRHNVCRSLQVYGVHRDGGFQQYVTADYKQVYQLPKEMPWEIAATVEPYSIAAQVIHRGRLTSEDCVLICGAGPIGLIILQVVKMMGAKAAIVDIVPSRLEKAKEIGADLVINSKEQDMIKEMKVFTNQDGASLIFEATGNIKVLESCIHDIASAAGRIVVLGFSKELVKIPQVDIMSRELEIIGTRLNNHRFAEVLTWFSQGRVNPEKVISHKYSFEDAQKAFDITHEHPEDVLKIILEF